MAVYYVDGKKINIPIHQKPFGQGSEGSLYLIDNKLYKIYNDNALNEGFGNKKIYHQALLEVNYLFKKFVLPESLIFDEKGDYIGYVAPLVGDKSKKKEGITSTSWGNFITNLKDFESEIDLLSDNRFLAIDIGFHNSVYSTDDKNLYMIDPGRYHHQSFFTIHDYTRRNRLILDNYFFHMLEREIVYFKLVPNKKTTALVQKIKEEKGKQNYSEYFENVKEKQDNVHEFLKIKGRYLH